MQSVKLYFIRILAFVLFIPVFSSCNKYEDGPMFSMMSRRSRLINEWKVDSYRINGTDFTSLVAGYTESFKKDDKYSYNWGILSGSGTWTFQNRAEEVKLSGNDDQTSRTLFLTKLENDQFWYYFLIGSDKHEMHLVSN
jgi:hypothetical protein